MTKPQRSEKLHHSHSAFQKLLDDAEQVLQKRLIGVYSIDSMLASLCEKIEAHFAEEETPDGLYAQIMELAPRLDHRIDELHKQHESLRSALHELKLASLGGDGSDTWWERLNSLFNELRQRLNEHETKEFQLIQDAYLVDVGSQD